MKINNLSGLLASILLLLASGQASAVIMTDRIDHTDGQANTYFLPSAADVYNSTYFRKHDEDWDWQHNAFAVNASDIVSASLSIRAWDIDPADPSFDLAAEIDEIWGDNNGTLEKIGTLVGVDNAFQTTTFNLESKWFDDIVGGLMLSILIDELDTHGVWRVSLDYAELTIDVRPGVVPVPAAVWLFGSALLGLAGFSRRKTDS